MKIPEHDLKRGQLSYFLGKVILVQTTAGSVTYDTSERSTFIHYRTYGGVCEGFDEYGVWLVNSQTGEKSYFFFAQIQGIVENQLVAEDHPLVKEELAKARREDERRQPAGRPPEPPLVELSLDRLHQALKEPQP